MKRNFLICLYLLLVAGAGLSFAKSNYDEINETGYSQPGKIESDQNYGSRSDMIRRIQRLEHKVWELQQHCGAGVYIESDAEKSNTRWTCKVKNQSKLFFGEGYTKGSAQREAMEACQVKNNPLFCREVNCESEELKK